MGALSPALAVPLSPALTLPSHPPSPSPRSAKRTALAEGLEMETDPKAPTGLLGVRARGAGDCMLIA